MSTTWIRKEEMDLASHVANLNLAHANDLSASVNFYETLYSRYGKRFLDILLSACAIIVLSPFNLLLAIATYFDVGKPIFYKQKRTGKGLLTFEIIKFRNMTNEVDSKGELLPPSQRVTKLGRFVRKYSIDELLNFWSVLKGDMSLIGPRPLPMEYEERLTERHKRRYAVRPGLECPLTEDVIKKYPFPEQFSRYHAQFENDIWYVENISFTTDARLLFRLVQMTCDMKYREKGASAASPFIGYDERGCAVSKKQWEKRHDSATYGQGGI